MFNLFNKKKSIVDLKDYEILSLAICALEEDLKYYDNYVSNFIIDYPVTSKIFKKMSNTKNEFRLKLINLYKKKFSHIMNISDTNQISNFYKRKPFWLVKLNSIEEVRSEIKKIKAKNLAEQDKLDTVAKTLFEAKLKAKELEYKNKVLSNRISILEEDLDL